MNLGNEKNEELEFICRTCLSAHNSEFLAVSIQGIQYVPCFVRVSRSVCHVERRTEAEDVREQGAENGTWS